MMTWWRADAEITKDSKLRELPVSQRWVWIALLCLAGRSPERGRLLLASDRPVTVGTIEDEAKVPLKDVRAALAEFTAMEMIHYDGDVIVITNWKKRQFESDDETGRKRDYRARKNGTRTGHSAGQERDNDGTLNGTSAGHVTPVSPPQTTDYRLQTADDIYTDDRLTDSVGGAGAKNGSRSVGQSDGKGDWDRAAARDQIAKALADNPHWKSEYDKRVRKAQDEDAYGLKLIVNWLKGDGTPEPPRKQRVVVASQEPPADVSPMPTVDTSRLADFRRRMEEQRRAREGGEGLNPSTVTTSGAKDPASITAALAGKMGVH